MPKKLQIIAFILFIFIPLLSAIPKKESTLAGSYRSKHNSLVRKGYAFFTNQGLVTGSEIKLHSDSTFLRTTCGSIATGKWHATKDTLYLTKLTAEFKNDSLNRNGWNGSFPLTGVTLKFRISANELSRTFISTTKDGNSKKSLLETLVKAEDQ